MKYLQSSRWLIGLWLGLAIILNACNGGNTGNNPTLSLTPESITLGTEESKNITLSLNNSFNVSNLNVSIDINNPATATVTPSSCRLSSQSPNCILTITGVGVESTNITAKTTNYGNATAIITVKNVYAYVANYISNTVSMFRLNSQTGQLTPLSPISSIIVAESPTAMSVDLSGQYLYVTTTDQTLKTAGVNMFSINPQTGNLTSLSTKLVPYIGNEPINMLINPLSGYLYLNTLSGSLSMYSQNFATGILSPLEPPSVNTAGNCFGLTLSPNGKFMYNSCGGGKSSSGNIVGYILEPNGQATVSFILDLDTQQLSGATINQLGSILYTLDNVNRHVLMFAIDSETGGLTPLNPQITISTGARPGSIILNKANTFAYVTNLADSSISMYQIDQETEILTPLTPESEISTGTSPSKIALDPSESFAYVTNTTDGTLSAYSVNQITGKLTPLAESSIITGEAPSGIVFN